MDVAVSNETVGSVHWGWWEGSTAQATQGVGE